MATTLSELISGEASKKADLEAKIGAGEAARSKLGEVTDRIAQLEALASRQAAAQAGADQSDKSAEAAFTEIGAGLTAVDVLLNGLPGALKVTDLNAVLGEDLPKPPDPARKKLGAYRTAYADAESALSDARATLEKARVTRQQALIKVAAAEAELRAAMTTRERALSEAKAALVEAGQATRAKNHAAAYWAASRARFALDIQADGTSKILIDTKALVAKEKGELDKVWTDVLGPAEKALIAAEKTFAEKEAARTKALAELQAAGAQVLAALERKVLAAKSG